MATLVIALRAGVPKFRKIVFAKKVLGLYIS